MKVVIADNERGFLLKNGKFMRILPPGKYRCFKRLGGNIVKMRADGRVDVGTVPLEVLRAHEDFRKCADLYEIADGQVALHFRDGHLIDTLTRGVHAFWNVLGKHTIELLDISDPAGANALDVGWLPYIPDTVVVSHVLEQHELGLLFYDGVFQKTLAPGRHTFYRYKVAIVIKKVDMRVQQLDLTGQEMLTADKVTLRVNFVCDYRIADPVRAFTELRDVQAQLHVSAQRALREHVGKLRLDELYRQKESVEVGVLAKLQEREAELCVRFLDAGIKDIVLPGEIRSIMNTVLVAEKTAQASVIARREEIASTKSLLDTARLMDENATLYRLKELEYLERICDKVGSISVNGAGGILSGLRELVASKAGPTQP